MNTEKTLTQLPLVGLVDELAEDPLPQQKPQLLEKTVVSEGVRKKVEELSLIRDQLKGHARMLVTRKIYYLLNPDKCLKWNRENRDKIKARSDAWYRANKARHRETTYRNRRKNIEKSRESVREWHRKHARQRLDYRKRFRRERPEFAISDRFRRRLNKALQRFNASKVEHSLKLLGCSVSELKEHIESQFTIGMSWENRESFDIDHVIPVAAFNLHDPEEQRWCFNWRNLQPLDPFRNRSKQATIPSPLPDWLPAPIAQRILQRSL